MDNEFNTVNAPVQEPEVNEQGSSAIDEQGRLVFIRSQLKKSYGTATMSAAVALIVIIVISMIMMGYNAVNVTAEQEPNDLVVLILNLIASPIGITAGLLYGYKTLKTFGIKDTLNTPFKGKGLVFGLFAALGIQGVMVYLIELMTSITGHSGMPEEMAQTISFGDDTVQNVIIFIYVVIIGPIFEEFMYRGFILNAMAPANRRFAVIVSALMFSLMHGNFAQIPNTFAVGIIWGYLAVKTGSIIPSVIAHIIMNFNAMVTQLIYTDEKQVMIHYAVTGAIGICCLIIYFVKNRKIEDKEMVVPLFAVDVPKTADNTWKLLIKCPSFWITTGYYIFNACVMFAMS